MNSIVADNKNIYRLIATFIVIFIGGLFVISQIYDTSHQVEHNMEMLVDDHLPKLDTVHQLQTNIKIMELVLYRYYETTDTQSYQQRWQANQQQINLLVSGLDKTLVSSVNKHLANLNTIAERFDAEMRRSSTDWNLLREQLANFKRVNVEFDEFINRQTIELRQSFKKYSNNTQSVISKMVVSQLLFSGFVLLLLAIVAFVLRRQLKQHYIHRELALYPERNPNPILKMNNNNESVYVNPSAIDLAESLGIRDELSRLLPPDYKDQSKQLFRTTLNSYESKVYALGDRQFSAFIHHLDGDDTFYAYLIDVTDRANAEKELKHQSNHDVLTGLPNRRKLEQALNQKCTETLTPFSLLLLKVGRLELINASLGHEISDRVLVAMSQRLQTFTQEQNKHELGLFSFDPTTWVIIFYNNATPALAKELGDELVNLFAYPLSVEDGDFNMQCSLGITLYPQGGCSTRELLRNADAALRQGAQEGLAVRLYSEDLTEKASRWLKIEQGLKQAVVKNELSLNIQPKVHASDGLFAGGEVLIRWNHEGDWISPAEFIPVAEDSDLIITIGEWVLTNACEQWVDWHKEGLDPKRLAVNISAQHFVQSDFVDLVKNTLIATGMPAAELELEITEEVATENPEKLIKTMSRLKSLGVRLAIDDFGTGYSSLSYLRRFPIDTLKIDQSFVFKMEDSENDAAIVRMVMSLAKELKLEVVAEGVEEESQYQTLSQLGCELIQGYYFYKPMDIESYQHLLSSQPAK